MACWMRIPFPERMPKVLESASPLDAQHIACGSRHAVLITRQRQVFSWGDGSDGKLGHGSEADIPNPQLVNALAGLNIVSVGCGEYHTCSLGEKEKNGQLGHGDNADENSPTLVKALEGKQVKRESFVETILCIDYSICAGCRNPFNFKSKRHNCYNCGLFFCKACINKKSLGASFALNPSKLYRVCEDCFSKLKNGLGTKVTSRPPKSSSSPCVHVDFISEFEERAPPNLSKVAHFLDYHHSIHSGGSIANFLREIRSHSQAVLLILHSTEET